MKLTEALWRTHCLRRGAVRWGVDFDCERARFYGWVRPDDSVLHEIEGAESGDLSGVLLYVESLAGENAILEERTKGLELIENRCDTCPLIECPFRGRRDLMEEDTILREQNALIRGIADACMNLRDLCNDLMTANVSRAVARRDAAKEAADVLAD